jgi:hypothetical protein
LKAISQNIHSFDVKKIDEHIRTAVRLGKEHIELKCRLQGSKLCKCIICRTTVCLTISIRGSDKLETAKCKQLKNSEIGMGHSHSGLQSTKDTELMTRSFVKSHLITSDFKPRAAMMTRM